MSPSFLQVYNTLDPLLAALTREYVDDADLSARLNSLFKVRAKLWRGWRGESGRGHGMRKGEPGTDRNWICPWMLTVLGWTRRMDGPENTELR